MRPLKLDKALEVVEMSPSKEAGVTHAQVVEDGAVNLKKTPYFTANLLTPTRTIQRDYAPLDSFVAYMCVEGQCSIKALDAEQDGAVTMKTGEAVLIPATLNDIVIEPDGRCQLLEIYMEV